MLRKVMWWWKPAIMTLNDKYFSTKENIVGIMVENEQAF